MACMYYIYGDFHLNELVERKLMQRGIESRYLCEASLDTSVQLCKQ